ncbi:YwmB family TATA-box binding protein [Heyndrickxia ginsengihumi]|uniref:YwmB family TATA-box binding protein n=1 Tax=Heyndrickxia ginsengihumi TaxID=363870 RepID=UPI0004B2D288|nr:YwmB family TATA-box binding protein [Heyndrickxia ginsengihumi]MCM3022149.1 YwmB family TATA-box binding protein [Heyndrickxia ginsengihumi]
MIKKYKLLWLCTVLVCLTLVFVGYRAKAQTFNSDLPFLIHTAESLNGKVTEWTLFTRETVHLASNKSWNQKTKSLHKQFPNMAWTYVKNRDSKTYTGISRKNNYVETIKLLSTNVNGKSYSFLIYEVSGKHWNDHKVKNLNKMVSSQLDKLYDKKPVIFSCIQGHFSDKIDNVLLYEKNRLLKSLQAKKVEALEENDFYSVSAYSSKLSQELSTKKKEEMNVQIGLRKSGLGANTNFVIGTPIITIEY